MPVTPFVGYRVLWLATAVALVLLAAPAPAGATLSPDQGTYNRGALPLIVKPPDMDPGGPQDPAGPGAGIPPAPPDLVATVPEPGGLLLSLLGSGLVGLTGLRRWRRRSRPAAPAQSR